MSASEPPLNLGGSLTHPRRDRASHARGEAAALMAVGAILSIGIASTGLLTFAYFSIASHVLGEVEAKRLDVLWSVMFVIISVIYRPIEQLLSRTIAERRARGQRRAPAAGADRDPGQLRAALPGRRAGAARTS